MFETLTNSMQSLISRLKGKGIITEVDLDEMLQKLRDAFIAVDIPLRTVKDILASLKHELIGKKILLKAKPDEHIVHAVYQKLKELLGDEEVRFVVNSQDNIIVAGLQGAGKTTTLSKLASYIHKQHPKNRILMASLDFHRPAAREQLAQLGHRIGVDVYTSMSQDPLQAVAEIQRYRSQHRYGVLLIDTAGRLHTSDELLAEIASVVALTNATHRILVIDGMTGQQSLHVAKEFQKAIDITGAIVTKLDSGARAGSVVGFRSTIRKPILFLGTGESLDELEPFIPERIARRLIGDGDLATLWEKAQARVTREEQERMEESFKKGKLTLEDFAQQLNLLNKLGSFASLLKYIPGMGGVTFTSEQMHKGEHSLRQFQAIINSMTPKERQMPEIVNGSRRQRIARGAGISVAEINRLLVTFEQSQKLVKLMRKIKPS